MTTGKFLKSHNNVVSHLRLAANTPLSSVAAKVLADPEVKPEDVVNILNGEPQTDRGFWRIALAALLLSARNSIDLPDMPQEVKDQLGDIVASAMRQNSDLYSNERFLQYSLDLISELESESDNAASENEDETNLTAGLKRVASSRFSGSLRFSSFGTHAAIAFNLIDEKGDSLFDEEILAEDMLFIVHSVLIGTRKTLEVIISNVSNEKILCSVPEDDLRSRAEEMKKNLDVVLDQLLSFRTFDKALRE